MVKIIATSAAAALVICALSSMPAAHPQHEIDTRATVSNAAAKGDRLDIRARWAACSQRPEFHYDGVCRYVGPRPARDAGKVLVVSTNRLPIAG